MMNMELGNPSFENVQPDDDENHVLRQSGKEIIASQVVRNSALLSLCVHDEESPVPVQVGVSTSAWLSQGLCHMKVVPHRRLY